MNSVYRYRYKHRQYSAPSPVYNTGITESSLTSIANLATRKLGYLQVSYRILERNFYESAQSNGVEQYSEQSRKPLSQQWILKKAKRLIYHRCIVSDLPSNLLKCFLLVTFPYMTDIYTQRTTKLFTPIIKSFIVLKVIIQNERTRWFVV